MTSAPPRLILRYVPAQRWVHWTGVATFGALLVTGLVLLVQPLGFLAAGGWTRAIHRVAAVPFVLLPLVYVVMLPRDARALVHESISFGGDDWAWLKRFPSYLLGSTAGLPPQGRINAGQKLHHAGTFASILAVSLSGIVLWFGKGHLGITGLAIAAMVHDVSMLLLFLLMAGHVYFTFLYGALPAMRTGYVSEEYARLEHARWLEGLPPETVRDDRR